MRINNISELNEKEELFEMANIQPKRTGIHSILYSKFNGKQIENNNVARVEVATNNGRISVEIEPDVKVSKDTDLSKFESEEVNKINEAVEYIKKHKDLFLKHWNGEIDDLELIQKIEEEK